MDQTKMSHLCIVLLIFWWDTGVTPWVVFSLWVSWNRKSSIVITFQFCSVTLWSKIITSCNDWFCLSKWYMTINLLPSICAEKQTPVVHTRLNDTWQFLSLNTHSNFKVCVASAFITWMYTNLFPIKRVISVRIWWFSFNVSSNVHRLVWLSHFCFLTGELKVISGNNINEFNLWLCLPKSKETSLVENGQPSVQWQWLTSLRNILTLKAKNSVKFEKYAKQF